MTVRLPPGCDRLMASPERVAIKIGADPHGLIPEALAGLELIATMYPDGITLTSGRDHAPHRVPNSLHYAGRAFDLRLRTWTGTPLDPIAMRSQLRKRLHPGWDVVQHAVPAGAPHIHCELDRWPGDDDDPGKGGGGDV